MVHPPGCGRGVFTYVHMSVTNGSDPVTHCCCHVSFGKWLAVGGGVRCIKDNGLSYNLWVVCGRSCMASL